MSLRLFTNRDVIAGSAFSATVAKFFERLVIELGETQATVTALDGLGTYVESFTQNGIASWASGVSKQVAALTLPAGTWDVSGQLTFTAAAITGTLSLANISLTPATNGSAGDRGRSETPAVPTASAGVTLTLSLVRLALTQTTSVYLNGQINFTAGTPTAGAFLRAMRVA